MLAKGMKVMVTLNIHTDLNIANGTRGEIQAIVLDPDGPEDANDGREVGLHKPPLYEVVKVENTQLKPLPRLDLGVALVPVTKMMKIGEGKKTSNKQRSR